MKTEQGIDLIVEVRRYRLYSEGQSPTYPGTRDYILTVLDGISTALDKGRDFSLGN